MPHSAAEHLDERIGIDEGVQMGSVRIGRRLHVVGRPATDHDPDGFAGSVVQKGRTVLGDVPYGRERSQLSQQLIPHVAFLGGQRVLVQDAASRRRR
jgi:hypothetical protein